MKFQVIQVNFGHSGLFRRSPTEIDVSSSVKFFCFWEESNVKLASHFSPQFRSALLPNDLWIVRERKKRKWIKSSALVFDKNWLVLWNCLASFHIKNDCIFFLLRSCRLYAIDHWWPKLILDMFQTFPQLYWLFFFFFFLFFFFSFWESPTLLTFFFFLENPLRYWLVLNK